MTDSTTENSPSTENPSEKNSILFVDDDKNLLLGLERSLRGMKRIWTMHFMSSGGEALELLQTTQVDIVVADMQMPKMDGATFLTEIKTLYPSTLRIVLSGETGDEFGCKALRVANQVLVKPCNSEVLKTTISRLLAILDRLGHDALKKKIIQQDTLPSVPEYYQELQATINNPNASIDMVAEVISRDMAMTAKILQLANSAFFGIASAPATTLKQALMRIGLSLVSDLVLATHVFASHEPQECPAFSLSRLWDHCLNVSKMSRDIARQQQQPQKVVDACMLSGLLHDIGKLIFAVCSPHEFQKLLSDVSLDSTQKVSEEKQAFGTTHADVGAYLAMIWGLPTNVADGIAYHHAIEEDPQAGKFTPSVAVHIANAVLDAQENKTELHLPIDYLTKVGLADSIPQWQKLASS